MALMSLMQYAEGPKCKVGALLANDIQGLIRVLAEAREVKQAENQIIANPGELVDTVVSRIGKLLDKEPEEGENHPYDAAIAAYSFVLSRASAEGVEKAFEILRNSERTDMPWTTMMCWWIRQRGGGPSKVANYWPEPELESVEADRGECALSTSSDSSGRVDFISEAG